MLGNSTLAMAASPRGVHPCPPGGPVSSLLGPTTRGQIRAGAPVLGACQGLCEQSQFQRRCICSHVVYSSAVLCC